MATNSIGAGMTNVALPLVSEEAALLARLAGQSTSRVNLIRDLILEGLRVRYPDVASQVATVRGERLRLKRGVACLIAGVIAIVASGSTVRPPVAARVWKSAAIAAWRKA